MKVHIIRANGTEEDVEHDPNESLSKLINADTMDHFMVDATHVAFVDDVGLYKNLPINHKATELYLKRCRPGTIAIIVGDIVIVEELPETATDEG